MASIRGLSIEMVRECDITFEQYRISAVFFMKEVHLECISKQISSNYAEKLES